MKVEDHVTRTTTTQTDIKTEMPNLPMEALPRGIDPGMVDFLDRRVGQIVAQQLAAHLNSTRDSREELRNELNLSLQEADRLTYRRRMTTYALVGVGSFGLGVGTTVMVQRIRARNRAMSGANNPAGNNGR